MTSSAAPWAIVPVKSFDGAKKRLSTILSKSQRRALAMAMIEDVLDALMATPGLAGIALVTVDADATLLAQRRGLRVISEGATEGQTGAVTGGMRVLGAEGCRGVVTFAGDIPLVTAAEVARVVGAWDGGKAFIVAPAHDDLGSNAVLCAPPNIVPLRFGDNSFFPHLDAARGVGIAPIVVRAPGIALDIDNPVDLQAFLAIPSETRARAVLDDIRL